MRLEWKAQLTNVVRSFECPPSPEPCSFHTAKRQDKPQYSAVSCSVGLNSFPKKSTNWSIQPCNKSTIGCPPPPPPPRCRHTVCSRLPAALLRVRTVPCLSTSNYVPLILGFFIFSVETQRPGSDLGIDPHPTQQNGTWSTPQPTPRTFS